MPYIYISWKEWRDKRQDIYNKDKFRSLFGYQRLDWEKSGYVMQCISAPIGCTYITRPDRDEPPLHIKFHRGYDDPVWDGTCYRERRDIETPEQKAAREFTELVRYKLGI